MAWSREAVWGQSALLMHAHKAAELPAVRVNKAFIKLRQGFKSVGDMVLCRSGWSWIHCVAQDNLEESLASTSLVLGLWACAVIPGRFRWFWILNSGHVTGIFHPGKDTIDIPRPHDCLFRPQYEEQQVTQPKLTYKRTLQTFPTYNISLFTWGTYTWP